MADTAFIDTTTRARNMTAQLIGAGVCIMTFGLLVFVVGFYAGLAHMARSINSAMSRDEVSA